MSQNDLVSPRVNSALLPNFVGKIVRLTGKVLRLSDSTGEILLQSSDQGQVRIIIKPSQNIVIDSTYIEVIGLVASNDSIKAHACINLGEELDLGLVDFVVQKWHDPRFSKCF